MREESLLAISRTLFEAAIWMDGRSDNFGLWIGKWQDNYSIYTRWGFVVLLCIFSKKYLFFVLIFFT